MLLSVDLLTPSQGQGHKKWCAAVEVNNHCRYERIWLKSCVQCPMLKFLPCRTEWTNRWTMAGWLTNTTDHIDENVTDMDQQVSLPNI